MSKATKPPRVVAELGRPETPEETAARKAENSRLYRQRKTINNLVFSLLTTVGLALVIFLMVPQGSNTADNSVDFAAVAEQAQLGTPETLVVPTLPADWTSNAAELRTSDGVSSWYIGLLTPKDGYIGLSQGLDANEDWTAAQLDSKTATGVTTVDGTQWTVYDHRDSARSTGNVAYAMAATVGRSTYLVYGTADEDEIMTVVEAITPQLGLEEQ
ncbi:DUF4245 domain-containing protein [Microbacteriaceae bacterium VKM Ac-2854]|nr:DUF4245 domain-containing protein [Microbacteriaceae bacterium VKM Ac-2854]